MDMSFARKNAQWAGARANRLNLASLLAESAIRQAVTHTAKSQALIEKKSNASETGCEVSAFAPEAGNQNRRLPASFSASAAALITPRQ
jgi:glycerol-3-phosphate O-acyltransferase